LPFRKKLYPKLYDPIANQPDEVCHRPERTEITAPWSPDEQRGHEYDPQKGKYKIGADEPKECTEDLVA
jgi:hypothetical protein